MTNLIVTTTADSGKGSLRDAIASAKDGDTIKFASSLSNTTITLNSQIKILSSITIDGSGARNLTLSGNQKTRIFEIGQRDYKKTVTIKKLTLSDGRAVSGTTTDSDIGQGGAIRVHDYSDLVLVQTTLKNNVGERGGAVYSGYGSSVTAHNSVFENNDGSIANDGFSAGAIAAQGEGGGEPDYDPGNGFVKIENSILRNNKGSSGGAVYTLLTPLTIEGSVLQGNEGTGDGGAVFTDGAGGKGDINSPLPDHIIIRDSQILDNTAKGQGGGLFLWLYGSDDEVLIENSVIEGNAVNRGGIYNDSKGGGIRVGGSGGKVTIRDTTVANNTAEKQGGGLWTDANSLEIEGSTFSGNQVKTADGKGDVGGAMALNMGEKPVTISNTTFVNNYADRDSGAIWGGKSTVLKNSIFAGNTAGVTKQGNTTFQFTDGGGNIVETMAGDRGPNVTVTAMYVDDLKLSDLKQVGSKLVHIPQVGSPVIREGRDAGAYDGTSTLPKPGTTLGSAADDMLRGTAKNDRLTGFRGNDVLIGGRGADVLDGGYGSDRFVFTGSSRQATFEQSHVGSLDRLVWFDANQGDRIQMDYDNNRSDSERPKALFNAGQVSGNSLTGALKTAYSDKNQQVSSEQTLDTNEAVLLHWKNRSFLSINNGAKGFSASTDWVIEVTGLKAPSAHASAGALPVDTYFA